MDLVAVVQILSGGLKDKEFVFENERIVFGRRAEPPIDVLFPAEEPGVSTEHMTLLRQGDGFLLVDERSRFGTYVLSVEPPDASALPPPQERVQSLSLPCGTVARVQLGIAGPICRIIVGAVVPFGRYQLLGLLGQGGMGAVHLARGLNLGRLVVLKLIRPGFAPAQLNVEDLLRDEARITAQVNHENVIGISDVDREAGSVFIAMEYLRGTSLRDIFRFCRERGLRCPPDLAAALVRQACTGLDAAHRAIQPDGQPLHIVHRDVSPQNIICTTDGIAKVIDFGVARARLRLSPTIGGVVGNPGYMSPEHVFRPDLVDRRSDVFSAGAVLFELCTGQRLNPGSAIEVIQAPPVEEICPDVSPLLARAINQALRQNPDERPESAAAFAALLREAEAEMGARFTEPAQVAQGLRDLGVPLLAAELRPLQAPPPALISGSQILSTRFAEGQLLAGRYRIIRSLALDLGVRFLHARLLVRRVTDPDAEPLLALCYGRATSPFALDEAEANHLFSFAESQRGADAEPTLPQVLDHGSCWRGGPSFLIAPQPRHLLSSLPGDLSAVELCEVASALFGSLRQLSARLPSAVPRGPSRDTLALTAWPPGTEQARAVFLDPPLAHVLGLPEAPGAEAEAMHHLARALVEVAGGSGAEAAAALAQGLDLPPLRPRPDGPLDERLLGVLADALRPGAAGRPGPAAALSRLRPESAEVQLQLPLRPGSQPGHAGLQVSVWHVHLEDVGGADPVPLRLPMPMLAGGGEDLLLLLPRTRETFALRLDPRRARRGQMELYQGSPDGEHRHYQIDLPLSGDVEVFVGYYRVGVQRIQVGAAAGPGARVRLGGLHIAAPPDAVRLFVLQTHGTRSGAVNLCCVTVQR